MLSVPLKFVVLMALKLVVLAVVWTLRIPSPENTPMFDNCAESTSKLTPLFVLIVSISPKTVVASPVLSTALTIS